MTTRTYSRADFERAGLAWTEGEFSDEWQPFRFLAAQRGLIFPPEGSKWDSWEDEHPSQRAMLIRAIRETPELLRTCIGRSRTWGEVIGHLTGARDEWRRRADAEAAREIAEHDAAVPTRAEAAEALGSIMRRFER